MKNQLRLAVALVLLGSAVAVLAQNGRITPITKLGKIKFPLATATPFKGKIPKVTPTPIGKGGSQGPRIGERFQLRVWAEVLPGMPTRSWFGTLKIDEQTRWSIAQAQATNYQRGPGQTLEISEDTANRQGGYFAYSTFYSSPRKVKLKFDLYSLDNGQTGLRAAYRDSIDLLQQSGKTYKCNMGKGEAALYVKVEQVGYMYGLRIERPLPTPIPTSRFRPPGGHRPR